MLPEQVWDADDLPAARMTRGGPTGSAMPLCWTHGEYVTLVRSQKDGTGFDRVPEAYERYVRQGRHGAVEMRALTHQPQRIPPGKTLRILLGSPATVRWSFDDWQSTRDEPARDNGLGCWFADLPSQPLASGSRIVFTFQWQDRWEGREFRVTVG